MPVVQQQGAAGPLIGCTTTVQEIVTASSQDVRGVLSADIAGGLGGDISILINYTNRVSLDMLRFSRWSFLLSPVYRFLTQLGVSDYWVGQAGFPPTDYSLGGVVDTQLDLSSTLAQIKRDTVFDRSNSVRLARTDNAPLGQVFELNAHPKLFANDPRTPYIISVYPPPDYGTTWNFTSIQRVNNLATFTTTQLSDFQVNENNNLAWISGVADTSFNGYFTIQQVANNQVTVYCPGANTTATAGTAASGYTIEFRFYNQRVQLTTPDQLIQIPDDYRDVVIAGVNELAFKYLQKDEDAQYWAQAYKSGKTQLVKDKNLFPRGEEFIRPDPLAIIQQTTTGIGLDSGLETSIP